MFSLPLFSRTILFLLISRFRCSALHSSILISPLIQIKCLPFFFFCSGSTPLSMNSITSVLLVLNFKPTSFAVHSNVLEALAMSIIVFLTVVYEFRYSQCIAVVDWQTFLRTTFSNVRLKIIGDNAFPYSNLDSAAKGVNVALSTQTLCCVFFIHNTVSLYTKFW